MITTISSSNGDFQLSELLKTGLIFKSSEMNWKNAMEAAKKLGDGWRLPTKKETEVSNHLWGCWDADDHGYSNSHRQFDCIPVRDLKDD